MRKYKGNKDEDIEIHANSDEDF